MSRTSLHRPRRPRAVSDRPANGTRLLPNPHSLNTHYKHCPKAHRLSLRSDQSLSRPVHVTGYGRSPDKNWLALSKGPRQVCATLTRRIPFASSGDAPERSVMSLPGAIAPPWAIAPFSDSPGLDLAGQSEQSDERRLKTNAPFKDSTVVTTGELPTTNAGHGSTLLSLRMVEHFWWTRPPHSENFSALLHILSEVRGKDSPVAALGEADPRSGGNESTLPFLRMVEHFWWTGLPHTENFSALLHILSEVRGKDSTVVTTGELRSTNAGHGSPLPSLRMVEHFWWIRLPHTENFSGLVHIPSEVRGCRRVVADVKRPQGRTPRIATGVDAFSHKPSGTFHPLPNKSKQSLNPMNHSADGNAPCSTPTHPLGEPVRLRRIIPNSHQAISGPSALGGRPLEESAPSPSKGRAGGGPRLPIRHTPPPPPTKGPRLLPHTPTISSARSKENVVFLQNNQNPCLKPQFNQTQHPPPPSPPAFPPTSAATAPAGAAGRPP